MHTTKQPAPHLRTTLTPPHQIILYIPITCADITAVLKIDTTTSHDNNPLGLHVRVSRHTLNTNGAHVQTTASENDKHTSRNPLRLRRHARLSSRTSPRRRDMTPNHSDCTSANRATHTIERCTIQHNQHTREHHTHLSRNLSIALTRADLLENVAST